MSAAVDVAVFETLRGDAALVGLVPGGIYRDAAPELVVDSDLNDPMQVFGIVSVRRDHEHPGFCGAPYEEIVYAVQFNAPSTDPAGAHAALARAEALLTGLTVPGYVVSCSRPVDRLPFVVVDGAIRWEARGVLWEIWAHAQP